jgi:predicted transcriptional regulator
MAVDRLSVTVPSKLGTALRRLAKARGTTVSTLVADAIAHQVRLAALDDALAAADRLFGPVPETMIAAAESELLPSRRRVPSRRSPAKAARSRQR